MPHRRNERYSINGQNSALSCIIARPIEIHKYWTVPRQTQRTTTPPFTKKWRLQYTHWRKGNPPELTTAKLVQAGGEDVITALTTICIRIWQTGEWPNQWTQSLVINLSNKGNLHQCQNYRTISLISHPSKVIGIIILNRLKPKGKKIIAEERQASEQGGASQSRSSTWECSVRNISRTNKIST